ncbi:MAG: DUF721 domain-containing protein [Gemmatales bacterium]|nr:DUF721 domain-containing protein [Gemmatales bacterium]MDW8388393.1 DUF721 domain-containing protein [Gemmatales bacterium]
MSRFPEPGPAGPEPLADILARLFAGRGLGAEQSRVALETAWRDTIGPERSVRTRLGEFRRGVLEVLVRDAVLMHQLAGFEKRKLIEGLQQRLGPQRVRDLRFRLAAW